MRVRAEEKPHVAGICNITCHYISVCHGFQVWELPSIIPLKCFSLSLSLSAFLLFFLSSCCFCRSPLGQSFVWCCFFPRDGRVSAADEPEGVIVILLLFACCPDVHVFSTTLLIVTHACLPVLTRGIELWDEESVNTSACTSHFLHLLWHCCALCHRVHPPLSCLTCPCHISSSLHWLSNLHTLCYSRPLLSHGPSIFPFSTLQIILSSHPYFPFVFFCFFSPCDLLPLQPLNIVPKAFLFLYHASGFHYALTASSCSG